MLPYIDDRSQSTPPRPSICALAVVVSCLISSMPVAAEPPVFRPGVVITSGGEPVPGDPSGYTIPCVGDWDSDGDLDLLVGAFVDGPVYLFINTAQEGEPVLEARGRLEADGEVISGPYG